MMKFIRRIWKAASESLGVQGIRLIAVVVFALMAVAVILHFIQGGE